MRQKHLFEHSQSPTKAIIGSDTRPGFIRRFALQCSSLRLAALLLPVLLGATAAYAGTPTPTRTSLAATPADSGTGTGATLIATVQTALGAAVDTGTVDFVLPNGQSLGSAPVAADGSATLVVAKLPAGVTAGVDGSSQLSVAARYNTTGASEAYAASSSIVTAVATPAATTQIPDFTVTGNPTSVTATQGSYGTTAITVTSVGGYAGAIEFSCSNLPARITCTFNPTQQTLSANGTFVSTLQLQTQAPSGTASSALITPTRLGLALAFPGALLLFGLSGRRAKAYRPAQMLGIALLLVGVGSGMSGCSQRYGYLHHPPSISPGTPAGTYPITVAVDGSQGSSVIERDVPLTLVVN